LLSILAWILANGAPGKPMHASVSVEFVAAALNGTPSSCHLGLDPCKTNLSGISQLRDSSTKQGFAIVVSQDRHVSVMWFNDEAVAVLRNPEWWL
jgi:hypothetical protein